MNNLEPVLSVLLDYAPALQRYFDVIGDGDAVLDKAQSLVAGRPAEPDIPDGWDDPEELSGALRECRKRALLTAALAEQAGRDAATSFAYLTGCAEGWIASAFQAALDTVCRAHGIAGMDFQEDFPWSVLGMGKLGAGEMNPSSDVDLMVVYSADGSLPGAASLSAHDLFEKVSRESARILSEMRGDGFCLRVDFDLRPEGRSGALANSVDAMLNYYEQHGSPLDRMALTRARPVAGDPDLGQGFVEAITPFVYPRSLVSGALASLSGVLGRLRGVRQRASGVFNLKTGRGGIRDVELYVAAHQLVHGGRFEELRDTRTLSVLKALSIQGLVEEKDGASLASAYLFLRRLEHLLQYREDRQTHDMPLSGEVPRDMAALVEEGLDAPGLLGRLDTLRAAVSLPADRMFGLSGDVSSTDGDAMDTFLSPSADPGARERAGRELGFVDVEAALSHLSRLCDTPSSPLHPVTQARFWGLDRAILRAVKKSVWPDGALEFLSRLARFQGNLRLFGLCGDDPGVLDSLVRVASSSQVVANAMARDAGLALEQALTGFKGGLPSPEALETEKKNLPGADDVEVAGDRLAAFRRRHVVEIAVADLADEANEGEVGTGLSLLADACIDGALSMTLGSNAEGLSVLGLGRLGGQEMGYLSDLDLVFVHDGRHQQYLPDVQRALGLLTTRGVAGAMYTLDLRLRPSGSQGPLLVEAAEIERYYGEDATGPEQLGALNLRFVAGDRCLGEDLVARVRRKCVARLTEPGSLDEVRRIRDKQHRGVEKSGRRAYDPKLEAGGLLDADTAVHLWGILGAADPSSVPTGTLAILGLLAGCEGPHKPDFAVLDRVYRYLLRLSNRAHLVLDRPITRASADGPAADRLARSLGFGLEDKPADEMWDAYRSALEDGRRVCQRLITGLPVTRTT